MTSAEQHLLTAPLIGTVLRLPRIGETIPVGETVAVVESMKMEHAVVSVQTCRVDGPSGRFASVVSAGVGVPGKTGSLDEAICS